MKSATRRSAERFRRRHVLPAKARQRDALLNQIIAQRAQAMDAVINLLFEHDPVGKILRLRGPGSATGVILEQTVREAAQKALFQGLEVTLGGNRPATPEHSSGVSETDDAEPAV